MNEDIKSLLSLQERDLELDRLQSEHAAIPARISGLHGEIQAAKVALEDAKKELTQLQLAKKQKELDLDAQEAAVRKHSGELNAVKTNEAYRALLGEIEKAKQTKSGLEDQILLIMEQMDQATKVWKEKEAGSKNHEGGLQKQISDLELKAKALEENMAAKKVERGQHLETLKKNDRGAIHENPQREARCRRCTDRERTVLWLPYEGLTKFDK